MPSISFYKYSFLSFYWLISSQSYSRICFKEDFLTSTSSRKRFCWFLALLKLIVMSWLWVSLGETPLLFELVTHWPNPYYPPLSATEQKLGDFKSPSSPKLSFWPFIWLISLTLIWISWCLLMINSYPFRI